MFLTNLNTWLIRIVNWVIVISMIFLVVCISLQIMNRYMIKTPMLWSEECARYAFVWLTMFGSAKAVREKSHIFIDVLEVFFKGKIARFFGILAGLVSMVFFITLVYVSVPWALMGMGVNTESLEWVPLGFFYLCIPVSGMLMILFGLEVLIGHFRREPAEEGGV